ncbi:hypothetical protein NBRC116590_28180 [Pelagimonas sp. KU-00592-HH]
MQQDSALSTSDPEKQVMIADMQLFQLPGAAQRELCEGHDLDAGCGVRLHRSGLRIGRNIKGFPDNSARPIPMCRACHE